MNDQEGRLPERGGKLGGRAHQQTLLHKAVRMGEKTLVWKKTHCHLTHSIQTNHSIPSE